MKHWSTKKDPPRWSVQDAKARFSELLDASVNDGPQIITKRGTETAVLVPIEEWNRLSKVKPRTLKELLLTDEARFDFEIPRLELRIRPANLDD
jgi:antitoxin Phd